MPEQPPPPASCWLLAVINQKRPHKKQKKLGHSALRLGHEMKKPGLATTGLLTTCIAGSSPQKMRERAGPAAENTAASPALSEGLSSPESISCAVRHTLDNQAFFRCSILNPSRAAQPNPPPAANSRVLGGTWGGLMAWGVRRCDLASALSAYTLHFGLPQNLQKGNSNTGVAFFFIFIFDFLGVPKADTPSLLDFASRTDPRSRHSSPYTCLNLDLHTPGVRSDGVASSVSTFPTNTTTSSTTSTTSTPSTNTTTSTNTSATMTMSAADDSLRPSVWVSSPPSGKVL